MSWFLFAIGSAVLASLSALIEKKTLMREHATEFVTLLAVFNALITLPLFFFIDYSKITLGAISLVYLASVLGSFAFLLITKCVRHMEISVVSPLLVLGPAVTALLAYFALGESLSFGQTIGIGLLVVGAYLLQTKGYMSFLAPLRNFTSSRYTWFLIGALLLYAICSNLDRLLLTRFALLPFEYIAFFHAFAAMNFIFFHMLFYDGYVGLSKGIRLFGLSIFLVALCTVGYRFLQAQAVSMIAVGLAVSVKRLSVLFTTVIGGRLFHEGALLRKSLACVVMLIGATVLVL